MPPIWVVSMEQSADRRREAARQLAALALPFEFFPAVDGRRLDPAESRASCSEEKARRLLGRPMTAGEIGCSLSHLAVYRRMLDADLDQLVVMEDDARAGTGLRYVLESSDRWPRDWELMYLCHFGNDASHISFRGSSPLGPGHRVVRFSDRPLGSVAYAIRASAARRLLDAGFPVSVPADELLNGYYVPVDVRRYGIDPVVVEHGDPGGSYLAAERAPANAAVQLSRHGVARFLPDGVYRRSRRIAKFGKRFLRRHIV